jgi:hypothetical protein
MTRPSSPFLVLPLAVTAVLALAGPALADSSGSAQLSATEVAVGETVLLTGKGYRPNSEVVCYRNGKEIVRVTADASGRMQCNVKNPAAGRAELRTVGADADGGTRTLTATVTVDASPSGGSSRVDAGSGGTAPGSSPDPAGLVLLGGGTALVLAGATRAAWSRR